MKTKPLSIAAAVLAALAMSACGDKPAEPKAAAPAAAAQAATTQAPAQEKPAAAAPQEKQAAVASTIEVDGNRATIKDGIDAAGEAKLKAASGITQLTLRKISDADLAKAVALLPDVTSIRIVSETLTDLSPLAKLGKLESLVLQTESASDFAPLAGLTGLTNLQVTAPVPSLAWMSKMTALKSIIIDGKDKLTDLQGLPSLPDMKRVDLTHLAPTDLAPLVAALPSLTNLELRYAKIADLAPLCQLSGLEKLNLYGSQLADFSPLAACSKLKQLMYYAVEGADFSTLGKLTQLEELDGGLTKLDSIAWLPNLTKLKKFDVFAEYVTDYSPLAKTNIEELKIWNMRAPVDLGPVGKMPALKKLTLDSLNNASGSKALAALPKLEELSIYGGYNKKEGEQFDFSGNGWAALKKLRLGGVPLQPAQIETMKKMPALEYLEVDKDSCAEDALTGFGPNVKVDYR